MCGMLLLLLRHLRMTSVSWDRTTFCNRAFIHSFIHSCMHACIHSFIYSFTYHNKSKKFIIQFPFLEFFDCVRVVLFECECACVCVCVMRLCVYLPLHTVCTFSRMVPVSKMSEKSDIPGFSSTYHF